MKYILVILSLMIGLYARADVNADKIMAKIKRDTKTYISADARATTENEAYDEAMKKLSEQITDYFKIERSGEEMPEAIYLSNLSSIYERITSKIDDNRYRVMLYVKKSNLMPINNGNNTVLLTKNESNSYITEELETTKQKRPTEAVVTLTPKNSALTEIMYISTREQLTNSLQTMRKSGKVSGAAAFPIGHADDFYVAIIDGDKVVKIIRFSEGQYIDITSGSPVDMNKFSNCTGYWFTL